MPSDHLPRPVGTVDGRVRADRRASAGGRRAARGDRRRSLAARALPLDERTRLLAAAGNVFEPDVEPRRRQIKAERRQRKQEKVRDDQAALTETGIRVLRAKPVFTTPDAFAPAEIEPTRSTTSWRRRSRSASRSSRSTATSASSSSRRSTTSTTSSARRAATSTSRKRTESADLRGRVALLTGGRVKIGYQAGIKLLRAGRRADRHDPLPARLGAALRAGARLRRVGPPARDLRARPAAHAERRGVLPPPAHHARPARLHRQQRLPDGAAAARLLRAHDGRRAGVARHAARRGAAPARRVRGPARLQPARRRRRCAGEAPLPASRTPRRCRRWRCCPRTPTAPTRLFPEGRLDQDLQQVDLRDAQLVAAAPRTRCRRSSCSRRSS